MKIEDSPENQKSPLTLSKFSGWSSGIAWFLLFSVTFSDQIFDMAESGNEVAIYLCLGPLFFLSMLGFIMGVITGVLAKNQQPPVDEEDRNFSANGIKYGLIGIGFVIAAPLINRLISPTGFELFDITKFFGG